MNAEPARIPVLVIGAGQAGLAAGYHLARTGIPFVILEAADRPGAAWTQRWDSLRLFTPARFSGLPGSPFPGPPGDWPSRDDVAAYLANYAKEHELPVQTGVTVASLTPGPDGHRVETTAGSYLARSVIVATGAFQVPHLPGFAGNLDPGVFALHTSAYRNPAQLPPGETLIVGSGNSGVQIAAELAASRTVHLAVGTRQQELPRSVLGQDIFWWLSRTGLLRAPLHRTPKWLVGEGDTLIGAQLDRVAEDSGLVLHPRVVEAGGRRVSFADDTSLDISSIVWATGYRPDYNWIHADVFDQTSGRPLHRRGVTRIPGLLFVGMENQWTTASALIGWVQRDAKHVVHQATLGSGRQ